MDLLDRWSVQKTTRRQRQQSSRQPAEEQFRASNSVADSASTIQSSPIIQEVLRSIQVRTSSRSTGHKRKLSRLNGNTFPDGLQETILDQVMALKMSNGTNAKDCFKNSTITWKFSTQKCWRGDVWTPSQPGSKTSSLPCRQERHFPLFNAK